MFVLAIDLGGTKAAFSVVDAKGNMLFSSRKLLQGSEGAAVGKLLCSEVSALYARAADEGKPIAAIGISVPGIVRKNEGTVWAPKIGGWENYPLLKEIRESVPGVPVVIESDRTCYILGEAWLGAARQCTDAVFLSVGTGIGAGILVNGTVLKGAHDIGGAVGWICVPHPLDAAAKLCALEEYASGNGMALLAKEWMQLKPEYRGVLRKADKITASAIIEAYESDPFAREIVNACIKMWAICVANLVSIFNPQKIIMGGGVFGPGARFLADVKQQAAQWAQPLGAELYTLEVSALGQHAGVLGAARAAFQWLHENIAADV